MDAETTSAAGARVWAVDDETKMLDVLGSLLRDAGYRFRGFEDPSELLAALSEEALRPELLLIDLNLPTMSGFDLIRKLRSLPDVAAVPVLVLTAVASEGALINAFEAGADDVVRKPFGMTELLARVGWQLKRSEQMSILRQQNRDLILLTELAKALSQEDGLSEVLRLLIDGVRRALRVERCGVYLVDETSRELRRAASHMEADELLESLDLRELPEVADRLAQRQPAFLDAEGTRRLLDAAGAGPAPGEDASTVIHPMLLRDELIGVLVVVAARPKLGVPPREKLIVEIVCDLAAVAVHRAELFESILRESHKIDQANRELAKTRDFLSNVIESSPDAIIASNRQGEILLYNRAAESIVGWAAERAVGGDVRMLYPAGGAERIMHKLRSEGFGGRGRLEAASEMVVDRQGREIPVEISAAIVYDEDGAETATVGIFTDLRRRMQMEAKLQEATEHLERSRRQAVIAELAGAAAHELNQPLTSLLGYAELLRKRVDRGHENWRAIETIYNESRRMADIVRKIGRITDYKTRAYVGGARIVDLEASSEVESVDAQQGEPAESGVDTEEREEQRGDQHSEGDTSRATTAAGAERQDGTQE